MILSIISKVAVEQSMDKVSGAINGITFSKVNKKMTYGGTKLFLDSAATKHSIFNPDVLDNIHTKNEVLHQNFNAGVSETNEWDFGKTSICG